MMTNVLSNESEQLRSFTRALKSNPNEDAGVKTDAKLQAKDLDSYYGKFHALTDINMEIPERRITAIIGPSGCGKSTLLRTLNRMGDLIPNSRAVGEIILDEQNILSPSVDVIEVRRRVGMVFQRPNPFQVDLR